VPIALPPGTSIAIFLLFMLYLWTKRRKPVYFDGDPFALGGRSASISAAARQAGAAAAQQAADRSVEPDAHEASTGVAEKEPQMQRQETLSKNWRSVICSPSRVADIATSCLVVTHR
jgi:hypothetical protein